MPWQNLLWSISTTIKSAKRLEKQELENGLKWKESQPCDYHLTRIHMISKSPEAITSHTCCWIIAKLNLVVHLWDMDGNSLMGCVCLSDIRNQPCHCIWVPSHWAKEMMIQQRKNQIVVLLTRKITIVSCDSSRDMTFICLNSDIRNLVLMIMLC